MYYLDEERWPCSSEAGRRWSARGTVVHRLRVCPEQKGAGRAFPAGLDGDGDGDADDDDEGGDDEDDYVHKDGDDDDDHEEDERRGRRRRRRRRRGAGLSASVIVSGRVLSLLPPADRRHAAVAPHSRLKAALLEEGACDTSEKEARQEGVLQK